MSSKIKHMKRSRRSHNDVGWQTGFKKLAFERELERSRAENIELGLKNLVRKAKDKIKGSKNGGDKDEQMDPNEREVS